MKPAGGVQIYTDEETGQFFTMVLEANFTAEHEFGVEDLRHLLGITGAGLGIESRSMSGEMRFPNEIMSFEGERPHFQTKGRKDPVRYLECSKHTSLNNSDQNAIFKHMRHPYRDQAALAEWDGGGFRILAYSDEARNAVADLEAALRSGDFAVWIGGTGNNPFAQGGLVLAIPSRVPQSAKDVMLENDLDARRLAEAAAATGIRDRLLEVNKEVPPYSFERRCGFYALSPKWVEGFEPMGRKLITEYPVVFFLNPMKQNENNHGWYTVEELDAWIAGEGPIPKNPIPSAAPRP